MLSIVRHMLVGQGSMRSEVSSILQSTLISFLLGFVYTLSCKKYPFCSLWIRRQDEKLIVNKSANFIYYQDLTQFRFFANSYLIVAIKCQVTSIGNSTNRTSAKATMSSTPNLKNLSVVHLHSKEKQRL